MNRPLSERDVKRGKSGTRALKHRGPDGVNYWVDRKKGVFIGHRRLAIIDPSERSSQPFEFKEFVLAYNGEIYNYKKIRSALISEGENFETEGDTETLIRAWRRYGHQTLDFIDGMFAFVIYDGNHVTLVVDPFGEKPLFYAETNDGLYVCSELRTLTRILDCQPEPTEFQITQYLSLGYLPSPETGFPGVRQLQPGSIRLYDNGKFIRQKQYWSVPNYSYGTGRIQRLSEADLQRICQKITESLEIRLTSDVPLCLFLSGGIDSSLVAALAKRELDVSLHCATVDFGENASAVEVEAARRTASFLGLDHEIIPARESPGSEAKDIIDLFGQPCDSITILAVKKMTAALAGRFKVGLTGQGGDEIFLGYGKHHHFYRHRLVYGLPRILKNALRAMVKPFERANRFGHVLNALFLVDEREKYLALRNYPAIFWLRRLPLYSNMLDGFPVNGARNFNVSLQKFIIADEMPNTRLLAMDLGGMRSNLELRTPFLSRPLVEELAQLDSRAFLAYGQKDVLRRILRQYLPETITDLPKRGFMLPPSRIAKDIEMSANPVPRIDKALFFEIVKNMKKGKGWERIAVRLSLLNEWA